MATCFGSFSSVKKELDDLDAEILRQTFQLKQLQIETRGSEAAEARAWSEYASRLSTISQLGCQIADEEVLLQVYQAAFKAIEDNEHAHQVEEEKALVCLENDVDAFVAQADHFAANFNKMVLTEKCQEQQGSMDQSQALLDGLKADMDKHKMASEGLAGQIKAKAEKVGELQKQLEDVDAAVKQREDEEHSARQRVQEMEQATIRELQKQLAGLTTQENMWIQRLAVLDVEEKTQAKEVEDLQACHKEKVAKLEKWKQAYDALCQDQTQSSKSGSALEPHSAKKAERQGRSILRPTNRTSGPLVTILEEENSPYTGLKGDAQMHEGLVQEPDSPPAGHTATSGAKEAQKQEPKRKRTACVYTETIITRTETSWAGKEKVREWRVDGPGPGNGDVHGKTSQQGLPVTKNWNAAPGYVAQEPYRLTRYFSVPQKQCLAHSLPSTGVRETAAATQQGNKLAPKKRVYSFVPASDLMTPPNQPPHAESRFPTGLRQQAYQQGRGIPGVLSTAKKDPLHPPGPVSSATGRQQPPQSQERDSNARGIPFGNESWPSSPSSSDSEPSPNLKVQLPNKEHLLPGNHLLAVSSKAKVTGRNYGPSSRAEGFPWPAHFLASRNKAAAHKQPGPQGGNPPKAAEDPFTKTVLPNKPQEIGKGRPGPLRGRGQRGKAQKLPKKPLKRAFAAEDSNGNGGLSSDAVANAPRRGRGSISSRGTGRGRPRKRQAQVQDDEDIFGGMRH